LHATGSAGSTINWYDAASGGVSLGSGPSFTTPTIPSSTNFYVAATSGGTSGSVGKAFYEGSDGYNTSGAYLIFDAISSFTINTVEVYPYSGTNGTTGTLTVELQNSTGTMLQTATFNVTASNDDVAPVTPTTLNLNFNVPIGTNHRLVYKSSTGITGLLRNSTASYVTLPYTLPGVCSITNSSVSGYYYYFYNWYVSNGCESGRVPVLATISAAPVLTVSPSQQSCAGQNVTLTVSSPNDPNYTYTWTPGNISGASITVNPTASTTYTVDAIDNSGGANAGCVNSGSVTLTVNPAPSTPTMTPASAVLL
jgi:hypothetical protein